MNFSRHVNALKCPKFIIIAQLIGKEFLFFFIFILPRLGMNRVLIKQQVMQDIESNLQGKQLDRRTH